jgi:hypothetical protein
MADIITKGVKFEGLNAAFGGNISIPGGSKLELYNNGLNYITYNSWYIWTGSDVIIRNSGSGPFKFQTNGANDALTLDSSQDATFAGNVTSKDTFILENSSGKRWQQLFDSNNWNIRYYNGSSWSADALAIDTSNNATFAGHTSAISSYAQNFYVTSSGTSVMNRIDNDGTQLYISYGGGSSRALEIKNSDGSATFNSSVTATFADFYAAGNGNAPILHVKDTADTFVALFEGNRAADTGADIRIRHWPTTAAESNRTHLFFEMKDDGNNVTKYGTIGCYIDDYTGGTEDGNLRFSVMKNSTSTETMRINSSGVGVDTTAPGGKFQVDEYTVASQGNQTSFGAISSFANSAASNLYLGLKNGTYPNRGWALNPTANGVNCDLVFYEHGNNGERFRINTGGNATFYGKVEVQNDTLQVRDTTSNKQIRIQASVGNNGRIQAHNTNVNVNQNLDIEALQIDLKTGSISGSANASTLLLNSSKNATFAGDVTIDEKIVALGGLSAYTAAASINAFSRTVSTNLYSALRVIENSSASSYWDIGATGGASTILNFYHNGTTTPKILFTHLGGATFAGNVIVPTQSANDNSTKVATTAYVQTEITDLIGDAPGALDTLNELAAAINDDASYAAGITTALGLKAPKASPIFTGVVKLPDGNAGAPALTFTGDTNTGIYRPSTDLIGFTTGGTERVRIGTSGILTIGPDDATKIQLLSNGDAYTTQTGGWRLNGTVGNTTWPSYGFYGDSGIGMYRIGTDILGFTTAAVERLRIDASGNSTFAGNVSHTGLTMTAGTDIDQIYTVTVSLTASTAWQDTGIDSSELATGTYIIQMFTDDHGNNSIAHYNEYYSGIMSWYGGATNSTEKDEIVLHRAGHACNTGDVFLRTERASGSDSHDLMLQIKTSNTASSAANYVFRFRRMI